MRVREELLWLHIFPSLGQGLEVRIAVIHSELCHLCEIRINDDTLPIFRLKNCAILLVCTCLQSCSKVSPDPVK